MPDVWHQKHQKHKLKQKKQWLLDQKSGVQGNDRQYGEQYRYNQVNQSFMLKELDLDQKLAAVLAGFFRSQFFFAQ